MKMSTEGLIALIGHEGIVRSRYKDSVGVWTIGVGHTAAAGGLNPATYSGTLTIQEVIDLLRKDIAKYEAAVDRAVTVPLKQHEFDALVSFHFNTGAIGRASFVKRLNAGDRAGAMVGMMDWRKPPEIIPRRTAERDLFQTGIYPEPYATEYPADHNGKVLWSKGKRVNVRELLGQSVAVPTPKPRPVPPANANKPASATSTGAKAAVAALIAALAAAGAWLGDFFGGWF